MSTVYKLVTNEYVKSIIFTYVTNSFKYKLYLVNKYYWEVFRIRFYTMKINEITINDLNKFLSNFRWYISESYLEDIKILNGKVNLYEFWYELHDYWYSSIFSPTDCLLNKTYMLKFKFVLTSRVEYCFVCEEVYRLSISHKFIESNLFNIKSCELLFKYLPKSLRRNSLVPCLSLREIYKIILTLYKEFPVKYKVIDGFIVLSKS